MRRLWLSAFAIHDGGGATLLNALLAAARGAIAHVWLDSRFRPEVPLGEGRITRVPPTFLSRVGVLRQLRRVGAPEDRLLCFNNLPPLGRPTAGTITYLHSRFPVGPVLGSRWSLRGRAALTAERLLFRAGLPHAGEIWVQTPSMAEMVAETAFGGPVRVMPFTPYAVEEGAPPGGHARAVAFAYPAVGQPHKNHVRLFQAWWILAAEGLAPRLAVTLRPADFTAFMGEAGLNPAACPHIRNCGVLPSEEADAMLGEADALIFPSLVESLGLPLLAARARHVPILAPEADYARDVCLPAETFDPRSPRSIADAVRRHMGVGRLPVRPLTPEAFTAALLR